MDIDRTSVTVRRDGSIALFRAQGSIPLTSFGGDALAVDEIFASDARIEQR